MIHIEAKDLSITINASDLGAGGDILTMVIAIMTATVALAIAWKKSTEDKGIVPKLKKTLTFLARVWLESEDKKEITPPKKKRYKGRHRA